MISGVIHGVICPPVRATLSTGGGAFTLTLNRQPITLNGQRITLRRAA